MNYAIHNLLQDLNNAGKKLMLWFRSDDADVLSERLQSVLHLFDEHRHPLLLAVIPARMNFISFEH